VKRRTTFRSLMIVLLIAAWPRVTSAGQAAGRLPDEPRYNKATVGSFTGVVTGISTHTGRRGTPRTRATLKTKDGIVEIHVGPTSFLNEKGLYLAAGDAVAVIGSKVKENAGELVIVRQVTKGEQILLLRNEEGRPLWEERHK